MSMSTGPGKGLAWRYAACLDVRIPKKVKTRLAALTTCHIALSITYQCTSYTFEHIEMPMLLGTMSDSGNEDQIKVTNQWLEPQTG
jgi:hypothetical protein